MWETTSSHVLHAVSSMRASSDSALMVENGRTTLGCCCDDDVVHVLGAAALIGLVDPATMDIAGCCCIGGC